MKFKVNLRVPSLRSRESSKLKVIVLIGPTASGKSELAVKLAKKFNGEIISADSRQVYRGLDIGTGKIPGKWVKLNVATNTRSRVSCNIFMYDRIPHYCIDFVPPKITYTVAGYKKCAEDAIQNITSRGKIPILVGGTGFWIDALVYGLFLPPVLPNLKLRKQLEKKNTAELLKILQKLDPRRAKTIEQKNPRRLIRAIEIAKSIGKVPKLRRKSPYDTLWIGLNPTYEVRLRKTKKRVEKMLKQGLLRETKKLLRQEISKKRVQEFGFEYRAVLDFIDKKISRRELPERLVRDTIKYARRQMTWWKRNREIRWIKNDGEAEPLILRFLHPT